MRRRDGSRHWIGQGAGDKLRKAVLRICEGEYERITGEKWDPSAWPPYSTLEKQYEEMRAAEKHLATAHSALTQLSEIASRSSSDRPSPVAVRRGEAGTLNKSGRPQQLAKRGKRATRTWDAADIHVHLWAEWAEKCLELTEDGCPMFVAPTSLHSWLVSILRASMEIPMKIERDKRRRQAAGGPVVWREQAREPKSREMAYATLLIGCWPSLKENGASANEVIRAETKAIAQACRRAKKGEEAGSAVDDMSTPARKPRGHTGG